MRVNARRLCCSVAAAAAAAAASQRIYRLSAPPPRAPQTFKSQGCSPEEYQSAPQTLVALFSRGVGPRTAGCLLWWSHGSCFLWKPDFFRAAAVRVCVCECGCVEGELGLIFEEMED